jgi:Spy/CpxP family protein refolding chaperone
MRILTISMIVCLGLTGVGLASPMCRALLRHGELAEDAGITDEQRVELEDLLGATEKRVIEGEARMRVKRLELQRLLRAEQPDMRAVRKLVDEAADARSSVMLARIERNVKMREILGSEQTERARKAMMMRAREGRSRDRGHACREGHRMKHEGMRERGMKRQGMRQPGRRPHGRSF